MATKINSGFHALSFYRVDCEANLLVKSINEIEDWIIQNCEGRYYIAQNEMFLHNIGQVKKYIIVFLEDETDVMALKLGWS